MVRDKIVLGIRDDDTREALLKERKLQLYKCIDMLSFTVSIHAQPSGEDRYYCA